MLLDKHFKQNHLPLQGSQKFRERDIWQLDVADCFQANLATITELYKHFLDPDAVDPHTSRPYTHLNLQQCMGFAPILELSQDDVAVAYSYSKMISIDEIKAYRQYDNLKPVEFCDFLARLADMKFSETRGMPSLDKLEGTLDILFKVIGKKRVSQGFDIEVSSESDYNSDE